MDLKTYQEQTGRTAIYKPELAPHYLFPGLHVEAGELQVKVYYNNDPIKELGDVMWFTSQIYNLINADMVINAEDEKWVRLMNRSHIALIIAEKSMLAASHWVKIVRDKSAKTNGDDLQIMVDHCLHIPTLVSALASHYDTTLDLVLDLNIINLNDRQRRGVLGGSGDDR